jgi:hypothetical protein
VFTQHIHGHSLAFVAAELNRLTDVLTGLVAKLAFMRACAIFCGQRSLLISDQTQVLFTVSEYLEFLMRHVLGDPHVGNPVGRFRSPGGRLPGLRRLRRSVNSNGLCPLRPRMRAKTRFQSSLTTWIELRMKNRPMSMQKGSKSPRNLRPLSRTLRIASPHDPRKRESLIPTSLTGRKQVSISHVQAP